MGRLLGLSRVAMRSVALLSSKPPSNYTASHYLAVHNGRSREKSEQDDSTIPEKTSDPLHILYCGSDSFSSAVLKALYHEHVDNPGLIQSIDVVVRPAKRTGRGLTKLTEPPMRSVAEGFGLPIHTRDTFTGWDMPTKINLIIAVSFGLFVPPRLLRAAKYGGLNLHPSLLPNLRGPAPLHHTLLRNYRTTAVTLQTLDHETFDNGLLLATTPLNRNKHSTLRIPEHCQTPEALQAFITPWAIQLLISGLRNKLHVPPLKEWKPPGWRRTIPKSFQYRLAPKITKRDRQVTSDFLRQWDAMTVYPVKASKASKKEVGPLLRRHRVIGPLWLLSRDRKGNQKRIIIEALEDLEAATIERYTPPAMLAPRTPTKSSPKDWHFAIPLEDELEDSSPSPSQEGDGDNTLQTPEQEPKEPMNLVFWAPKDHTSTRSPSVVGTPFDSASEAGAVYLGPYRIISLKAEGDKAKPAWDVLRKFVVDFEGHQAYQKQRETKIWRAKKEEQQMNDDITNSSIDEGWNNPLDSWENGGKQPRLHSYIIQDGKIRVRKTPFPSFPS